VEVEIGEKKHETIKIITRIKPTFKPGVLECIKTENKTVKICNPLYLSHDKKFQECWRDFEIGEIVPENVGNS
jgi:hypothetical protein